MIRDLYDKKSEYIKSLYAREFTDLNAIEFSDEKPGMQLGSDEGKLLFVLIKIHQVQTILEIGSFLGYSAIWMSKALSNEGKVVTIEKDANYAKQAKENFINCKVEEKIDILQGDAMEILPTLQNHLFDMIFIDANKSGYLDYLDFAEKMLKKNGLLVVDNTLLFDTVFDDEVNVNSITKQTIENMKKFNKRLSDNNKFCSILLPTEQGFTISLKTF